MACPFVVPVLVVLVAPVSVATGNFPQLTDEQKQCLADHGLTLGQKPADGSRDAFKAAAEACGAHRAHTWGRPTI